jgi:hypothetical protein
MAGDGIQWAPQPPTQISPLTISPLTPSASQGLALERFGEEEQGVRGCASRKPSPGAGRGEAVRDLPQRVEPAASIWDTFDLAGPGPRGFGEEEQGVRGCARLTCDLNCCGRKNALLGRVRASLGACSVSPPTQAALGQATSPHPGPDLGISPERPDAWMVCPPAGRGDRTAALGS